VNVQAIDAAGMDRKRIAQTGASAVLKMIMMMGYSMPIRTRGIFSYCCERIAFIDFGMIGASLRSDGNRL